MNQDSFSKDTRKVAKNLIGNKIVKGKTEAEIVETEAYLGDQDPASHAFNGKTDRNRPMFETPGKAYIYVSYGIHRMFNVVAHNENGVGAVLIRAAKPTKGLDIMKERRNVEDEKSLADGPGKLTEALGIDKGDNRADLLSGEFRIDDGREVEKIRESKRIGISQGTELDYRYFIPDSDYVSR